MEGAAQMDIQHGFEVFVTELCQTAASYDPGVVHDDVDSAPGVDGALNDGLTAFRRGHRVGVGDGFAPGRTNFLHDFFGGAGIGAIAAHADTGVVDHDSGAARGEQQGVGAAQAATGPGDDRYSVIESEFCHGDLLGRLCRQGPLRGSAHYARSPQCMNLLWCQFQNVCQYVVGVLPQHRRSSRHRLPRSGKFDGAVDDGYFAEFPVFCLYHHLALDRLRLGQRILDAENRCVRHLIAGKAFDQVVDGVATGEVRHQPVDFVAGVAALLDAVVARVVD